MDARAGTRSIPKTRQITEAKEVPRSRRATLETEPRTIEDISTWIELAPSSVRRT
jgi:hypothetical protein